MSKQPNQNKWYNLFMGAMGELAGGDHSKLQECLPAEWKTETGASDDKGETAAVEESSSVLQKVIDAIGFAIDQVCQFKDTVKGFLIKKLMRKYHLKYSFLARKLRKWGWLSNAWNAVKSAASTVGNAVVNTAKAGWEAVKSGATWVWDQVKSVVMAIVNKLVEIWDSVTAKVKAIINHPIIQQLLRIF